MRRVALVGMQGAGHESESDSVGIPPICGKIGDGLLLLYSHVKVIDSCNHCRCRHSKQYQLGVRPA